MKDITDQYDDIDRMKADLAELRRQAAIKKRAGDDVNELNNRISKQIWRVTIAYIDLYLTVVKEQI